MKITANREALAGVFGSYDINSSDPDFRGYIFVEIGPYAFDTDVYIIT